MLLLATMASSNSRSLSLHAAMVKWFFDHQAAHVITQLVIFLNLIAVTAAQLDPSLGFTATCPMESLSQRVVELNEACCIGDQCTGTCDTDCVAKLFPLLDDCHPVLNTLFDGMDGTFDGEASGLTETYNQCLAIPASDIIGMLKTLQDRGQCPPTALDAVGETEVVVGPCANVWGGERCELGVASGVMTCDRDFCNTVPTKNNPCVVAGQCDRTCGFCSDDSSEGHRRALALLEKLRRLQMAHVRCNPATFADEAATVDDACCDGAPD
eukprot:SAG11_NODE_2246_length_3639_cov_1.957062_5_plen_269_part_00